MTEPDLNLIGKRVEDLTVRTRAVESELHSMREVLSTLVEEIHALGPRLERAITLEVGTAMMRFRTDVQERIERLEAK